mgnify:CR=1
MPAWPEPVTVARAVRQEWAQPGRSLFRVEPAGECGAKHIDDLEHPLRLWQQPHYIHLERIAVSWGQTPLLCD